MYVVLLHLSGKKHGRERKIESISRMLTNVISGLEDYG